MADTIKEMLRAVAELWLAQIKLCEKAKQRDFGAVAEEILRYAGKRYDAPPFSSSDQTPPELRNDDYRTVVNYTQLFVDTLTPDVFARVPNRLAAPARPQIPAELEAGVPDVVAMQAALRQRDSWLSYEMQSALNWFPKIYNLSREGEIAVRDALMVGRGCLWLEMVDGPTGELPASMADSWRNLLVDADAQQLRSASFIVRKRRQVAWKIADLYGEDAKDIRATAKSNLTLAAEEANRTSGTNDEESDLATYYEVWSVMGLGDKLVGADDTLTADGPIRTAIEACGPYVHFAVMPGMDRPLGMKPEAIEALAQSPDALLALLKAMLDWPIKTYGNIENPWPVRCLDLKPQSDKPWPKPILEAALPLLRFIDDVYQSLLLRARKAGKDIILTSLAIDEDVIEAIKNLEDLPVVKSSETSMRALKDLVDFLSFPEVNKDVFTILNLADAMFRELTGLDPTTSGSTPRTQERSAQASKMRQQGLGRRPSEYADKVEAFMSENGMAEAIAARMLVVAETIAPLYGEIVQDGATGAPADENTALPIYGPFTKFWVETVHTDDPYLAASEIEYTVEAGSGRRRNKQLQQENAQQMYTMLGQQVYSLCMALQNLEPYLMLIRMLGEPFEMAIEPLIQSIREAMSLFQQKQLAAPAPGGEGATEPSPGGTTGPLPGATALPLQWMGAAGGPRKMNLPPPPETL